MTTVVHYYEKRRPVLEKAVANTIPKKPYEFVERKEGERRGGGKFAEYMAIKESFDMKPHGRHGRRDIVSGCVSGTAHALRIS